MKGELRAFTGPVTAGAKGPTSTSLLRKGEERSRDDANTRGGGFVVSSADERTLDILLNVSGGGRRKRGRATLRKRGRRV